MTQRHSVADAGPLGIARVVAHKLRPTGDRTAQDLADGARVGVVPVRRHPRGTMTGGVGGAWPRQGLCWLFVHPGGRGWTKSQHSQERSAGAA